MAGPPPGPMQGGMPPLDMAGLKRGFMAQTLGAPEGGAPPNYRPADSPEQACMTCSDFRPSGPQGGGCGRFLGAPVEMTGVCDAWTPQGGGPEGMAPPMVTAGPMG